MSAIRQSVESCARSIAGGRSKAGALRRPTAALLLLAVVAGCVGLATWPPLTAQPRPSIRVGATYPVPGEYVVTFGGGIAGIPLRGETAAQAARRRQAFIDSEAAEVAAIRAGGQIQYRYLNAVIGFAGNLPPAALEAVTRATRGRARIAPNWASRQEAFEERQTPRKAPPLAVMNVPASPMGAMKMAPPPPLPFSGAMKVAPPPPLPYGLDRIGQRLLNLNKVFPRPSPGSREVRVYVIDSGIRSAHSEFVSRVGPGYNAYKSAPDDACKMHGTHVAGTIGGKNVGVAPFVKLYSVRVIDCWDIVTSAAAIAGVDWVLDEYDDHGKSSVANMSLEFDIKIPDLDSAINNSITAGITYVVAAGNRNDNACKVSPAWIQRAITVASVDPESDEKVGKTGGTCIDLFAPGEAIYSATAAHNTAYAYADGTSSAAPHAAGVAALVLSRQNIRPAAVWNVIAAAANVHGTPQWCGVGKHETAPNRLLHWGAVGPPHNGKTDAASEKPLPPVPTCSKK